MHRRHETELGEFQRRCKTEMDPLWNKMLEQAGWEPGPNVQIDARYLPSHGIAFLIEHQDDGSSREKMH